MSRSQWMDRQPTFKELRLATKLPLRGSKIEVIDVESQLPPRPWSGSAKLTLSTKIGEIKIFARWADGNDGTRAETRAEAQFPYEYGGICAVDFVRLGELNPPRAISLICQRIVERIKLTD